MMEDNKQLALRIDGAVQSASQEVTNLRAELTATNRRLAELSGGGGPGPGPAAATSASAAADSAAANMENHQLGAQGRDRPGGEASEHAGPEVAGDSAPPMPGRNRFALCW
uniref:Kazrin n=1 Tax=Urocitellus parryii TaxID=9999 RepID=A0A8D2HAT7_UROPR